MKVYITFQKGVFDDEEIAAIFMNEADAWKAVKDRRLFTRVEEYTVEGADKE